MNKVNFHIHSTGSDGKLTPEEIVKEAIKAGITHICFTDHYKRPEGTEVNDWSKEFHSDNYFREVDRLKKEYEDKINIYFGVEFDWFEEHKDWIVGEIKKRDYDFILGSVHFLKFKEKYLILGWFDKFWEEILKKTHPDKYVREYYNQVRLMVESGLFDCVSHLDVVKVGNVNNKYFDKNSEWYKKEVLETLDTIKKEGIAIEINASGWTTSQGEQYPSEWILREAFSRGIPIVIGTDFHGNNDGDNPYKIDYDRIDTNLEGAYELARKVGYKSVLIFKNRKREEVEI